MAVWGVGAALMGALVSWRLESLAPLAQVASARWTGYGALIFLLLSQAMTPAHRRGWLSSALRLAARRDFGIAAALLATMHLAVTWRGFLAGQLVAALSGRGWLQAGLLAWVLLALLWLTSYPALVRRLKWQAWRPLHRLASLALVLALGHQLGSPYGLRRVGLALVGLSALLGAGRLLPGKPQRSAAAGRETAPHDQ